MASISNVSLSIENGSTANTKKVTVNGTLTFVAGNVGKSYRLVIKLRGEDKAGDNLPDTDSGPDDELFTYTWSNPVRSYKVISVTSAGSQNFSHMRVISAGILDEDSGKVYIGSPAPHSPAFLPRDDEIYATVTLKNPPVPSAVEPTARSSTVIVSGFGV